MSSIVLDTNVLIDYVMPDRSESDSALRLVLACHRHEHTAYVSASSLNDFYYVSRKFIGEQAARDWVNLFIRMFEIEPLDVEACVIAVSSDEPDFEDACIRAIAEREQADFIITRDRTAFARSWVKTYSPRRFLELFPPRDPA